MRVFVSPCVSEVFALSSGGHLFWVCKRLSTWFGCKFCMPLTEKVTFTGALQSSCQVQVTRNIRGRFKLEPSQLLKVGVNFLDLHRGWHFFYSKMRKDGRITIPKIVLSRVQDDQTRLAGSALEVTLEPA